MNEGKTLTLILGGARSGKSAFAERLAAPFQRVLYVATAEALDEDMAARISVHRASRPPSWQTLEEPRSLETAIPKATPGCDLVLLDCLTLWTSNLMLQEPAVTDAAIQERVGALLGTYETGTASWIVVSNEVGLGVSPPTALGGRYRDVLGRANQTFAAAAGQVYLMVAGLALDVTALGAKPWPRLLA